MVGSASYTDPTFSTDKECQKTTRNIIEYNTQTQEKPLPHA